MNVPTYLIAQNIHGPCFTTPNLFFDKKKKIGKFTAKLTFLWYDNFGENQTPLQRNSLSAIPKISYMVNLKLSLNDDLIRDILLIIDPKSGRVFYLWSTRL